uniref:caffeate O-methyltransferase n=1 Tax=Hevea brasiliensis TaxID=3981 RepID=H9BMN2_HEVBR|nr:caffeic acid 3-O-methyltransferase [Hevea brasiliensis]AGD80033.1 caffeic acid O-methyltransferase [Hevea brasiliensis]
MTGSEQSNSASIMSGRSDEETWNLAIDLANTVILPMVLKSALELNVIDIISTAGNSGASLSAPEIAQRIPEAKNPEAPVLLDRMLRLLATYDIVKCSSNTKENGEVERLYAPGPICKFLTKNKNGSGSAAPLLLLHHDEVFMKSWYHLNEAILEGGTPFNRAYGMNQFEYPGTDQRFNRVFNDAMSSYTTYLVKKILDAYKGFDGLKSLVDVGGNSGVTLNSITSKYPHIKGINYDLPHVLADAPSYPGVEHVAGDMFKSVPKGDAIILKWVLHDWNDDLCLKLLKNCWEALPSNGKVIVVESILPTVPENNVTSQVLHKEDLMLLSFNVGGKERTRQEFEALASKSGFSSCEFICCAYNSWVIEFHK